MTGQKIVLTDVSFTDTTLPIIRSDRILSSGSLFLFDPSHSMGAFDGAANQTFVPNVAAGEASALIAGSTADTLSGRVFLSLVDGQILVERTLKGGVHIINSQLNQTGDRYWCVQLTGANSKISEYMVANSSHKFYVSLWSRCTRGGVGPLSSNFHLFNTPNNMFISPGGSPSGINKMSYRSLDTNSSIAPFNRFANSDINGVTGTPNLFQLGGGMLSSYSGSTYWNKQNSVILYRAYIEDLTVSGRTYAEVDAIDYQMYQSAFAEGGKFYGDTYSDPSVLP